MSNLSVCRLQTWVCQMKRRVCYWSKALCCLATCPWPNRRRRHCGQCGGKSATK